MPFCQLIIYISFSSINHRMWLLLSSFHLKMSNSSNTWPCSWLRSSPEAEGVAMTELPVLDFHQKHQLNNLFSQGTKCQLLHYRICGNNQYICFQLKIDSQLDHFYVLWLPHAKNYTTAEIKESKHNRKPLDHEEHRDYFKNSKDKRWHQEICTYQQLILDCNQLAS